MRNVQQTYFQINNIQQSKDVEIQKVYIFKVLEIKPFVISF